MKLWLYPILSQDWKTKYRNVFVVITLFLFGALTPTNVSAITAQEVMENALEVYKNIDNYKAVVHTYEAKSMEVSSSDFEDKEPIVSFNLFFRKPNEHAVQKIAKSRHGIFRVELLSALSHLKDKEINLKRRELLRGQRCHVLEVTSADDPDTVIKLWISSRSWTVQQFTLIINALTLSTTQFKYPLGGNRRVRALPIETRSYFPLSKKVLVNRIMNHQVNTDISPEVFEKKQNREQPK